MRFIFLLLLGIVLSSCAKVKNLSASQIKTKIDAVYFSPSSDLLPPEFNAPSLENEYYCDTIYFNGHTFVLRLRDNNAFIYETYYKPYNWVRIDYRIGNFHISGDTIHINYKSLLKGKADGSYVMPWWHVSWIPPAPPEYLLLQNGRLFDPSKKRLFYMLTEKPKFDLKSIN